MDLVLHLDTRDVTNNEGNPIRPLYLKRGDAAPWRVRVEGNGYVGSTVTFAAIVPSFSSGANVIKVDSVIGADGYATLTPQSHTTGLDEALGLGTSNAVRSVMLAGEFKLSTSSGIVIATLDIPLRYMMGIIVDGSDPEQLESTKLVAGETVTLPAGSQADAEIVYEGGNYVAKFKIPQGLKGDKGEPGINGKDGVDGQNGTNGKDGKDGAPGGIIDIDGKTGKLFLGTGLSWNGNTINASGGSGDLKLYSIGDIYSPPDTYSVVHNRIGFVGDYSGSNKPDNDCPQLYFKYAGMNSSNTYALPSGGYSVFKDKWLTNVAMVKKLIDSYGGGGGSGDTTDVPGTGDYLPVYSHGSNYSPYSERSEIYDPINIIGEYSSDYNTSVYGVPWMQFRDTGGTSYYNKPGVGFSEYQDKWLVNVGMVKELIDNYGSSGGGGNYLPASWSDGGNRYDIEHNVSIQAGNTLSADYFETRRGAFLNTDDYSSKNRFIMGITVPESNFSSGNYGYMGWPRLGAWRVNRSGDKRDHHDAVFPFGNFSTMDNTCIVNLGVLKYALLKFMEEWSGGSGTLGPYWSNYSQLDQY